MSDTTIVDAAAARMPSEYGYVVDVEVAQKLERDRYRLIQALEDVLRAIRVSEVSESKKERRNARIAITRACVSATTTILSLEAK